MKRKYSSQFYIDCVILAIMIAIVIPFFIHFHSERIYILHKNVPVYTKGYSAHEIFYIVYLEKDSEGTIWSFSNAKRKPFTEDYFYMGHNKETKK